MPQGRKHETSGHVRPGRRAAADKLQDQEERCRNCHTDESSTSADMGSRSANPAAFSDEHLRRLTGSTANRRACTSRTIGEKGSVMPAWNTHFMHRLTADSVGVEIAARRELKPGLNWALIRALTLCLAFWAMIIAGLTLIAF